MTLMLQPAPLDRKRAVLALFLNSAAGPSLFPAGVSVEVREADRVEVERLAREEFGDDLDDFCESFWALAFCEGGIAADGTGEWMRSFLLTEVRAAAAVGV